MPETPDAVAAAKAWLEEHEQAKTQWKRAQERLGKPTPDERADHQQLRLQLQQKLKQAERIEELMTRQGELHDALEAEISALEELVVQMQPAPEEAGGGQAGGSVH